MTAEVAVLNRIGVALAADSAVTIGRDADKIYTSAEKLFQLSPCTPIGIMVYGNADFCGLPWETIIKTYRESHGNDAFDTVVACGEHFVDFLSNARDLFPQNRQDEHVEGLLGSLLLFARDQLQERLDNEAEEQNGLNEEDLGPVIESAFESLLAVIRKHDFLPGFDEHARVTAASRFQKKISELVNQVFGSLPFTERASDLLMSIAQEMLVRHFFGPLECGLVIGGFGTNEFMPSLISYELEEIVIGIPRAIKTQSHTIGDDSAAAVIPFAQKDMVESFMEGIHNQLHSHMKDTTAGLFQGALDRVLTAVAERDEAFANELREATKSGLCGMLDRLFEDWKQRRQQYWQPVVEVVASLPKDELAAMAEALVNLTKFRRRISPLRETVGGPIDVAVITKGDGFVWTRRKHYFNPELNPRVIARLQRKV